MEFTLRPGARPAGGNGGAGAPSDAVVKDSDTAHFMVDVIEASRTVPVIVDFWAPWCGPCKQLGPVIEDQVRKAGGLLRLVKINVDENQQLAAQMRIQSIPAVYAFKGGQPVDGFVGALPDSQIKAFIKRLLGDAKPPLDEAVEQARELLDSGDASGASEIFAAVLEEEPGHAGATAGMMRALTAAGDIGKARAMADRLSAALKQNAEVAAAVSALELAEQSRGAADNLAELHSRVERDPADHGARFDLATALYASGRIDDAIDELLESVRRNREWNEQAARKQLVKVFEALGHTDPRTVAGRKRLSSILFS